MHRTFAILCVLFLVVCAAQAQVSNVFNMPVGQTSLLFVPVGNPGNVADPATGSVYGSVGYAYRMGEYDVTVGQYVQFLNAVAKTDTYGLYNGYGLGRQLLQGFSTPLGQRYSSSRGVSRRTELDTFPGSGRTLHVGSDTPF